MYNKKSIIIAVMLIAVVFLSIGYAYFSTTLYINGTSNITTNWNVYFESISAGTITGTATNASTPSVSGTSATISVNLATPGDKMVYQLVLKNGGDFDAVIEDVIAKAEGSSAIIYSIEGIKIGDKLASGQSIPITLSVEYDYYVTSQPEETSKTLTISILTNQDIGQDVEDGDIIIDQPLHLYLANKILQDNIAYADNVRSEFVDSDTGIDFSQVSSDTNGKGLYYTSTNTENNLPTYYFRGNVQNNYVAFGKEYTMEKACIYNGERIYNEDGTNPTEEPCIYWTVCLKTDGTPIVMQPSACSYAGYTNTNEYPTYEQVVVETGNDMLWRIVRINEDGSVRLITQDSVGTSAFNTDYFSHNGIGYMYGASYSTYEETHANTKNSTIKDYLDDWYTNVLNNYSSYIVDAGFCNDRSVAPSAGLWHADDTALGYGGGYTWYGSYNRLTNLKQPQLSCSQTNDLFTLKGSNKGNKALDYAIGLISIDEVNYAGAVENKNNSDMYLSGSATWTMSPSYVGVSARPWFMNSAGGIEVLTASGAGNIRGVRPVINIKGDIEVELTGTGNPGTATNPYIIKTN